MMAFIDQHRGRFGVEPLCAVLRISSSSYYDYKSRETDTAHQSARWHRDEELKPPIQRGWNENLSVYGVRKVWRQLHREGESVARCTVARLMKSLGLAGVVRGKRRRTTIPDALAERPRDPVRRQFVAERPNQLWVADFTYVSTWSGVIFAAFVTDVFSRAIVGWRVSQSMTTEFVLDALEQALQARKCWNLPKN